MALFLIMGVNHTHPDPVKDARGCYKLGDIVEVMDDAKHDGNIVANPIASPFYLVRVTGVTKAQALKYLAPETDAQGVRVRRRLRKLNVASIPLSIKNTLQANRYVEVTLTQVQNYLLNKSTGLPD